MWADGSCTVEDNGRWIPTATHPKTWKSTLETILTILHAGGKFGWGGYKVSWGLHWVGSSVVNALSSKMEAWIHRDWKIFYQSYSAWKPDSDIQILWDSKKTWTIIKFFPDETIFKITTEFDYQTIKDRLRQQAYLTKWITIYLIDERTNSRYKYYFEWWIKSYVNFLNRWEDTLWEIFYVEKENKDILVEISLQYNKDYSDNIISFVNNIHTPGGWTHLTWFRTALTRTINKYARDKWLLKEKDQNLTNDDVIEWITAVVSVKVQDPQFEWQTKDKLWTAEARWAVDSVFSEKFSEFLDEDPNTAKKVVEKVFQAILPLRWKILNTEQARIDKIFSNQEIKNLIIAFWTSIWESFDISKLRYHRIVIMTDADVDGAHIRTLLLTFFFRYLKELIIWWYVYIAQPPLYRLVKWKKSWYVYSEEEKQKIIDEEWISWDNVQRYKGLWEMNPEELWATTMDPKVRKMYRVSIWDAQKADEIFKILMWWDVAPRRRFIQSKAKEVKNLDV